MKHYHQKVRLSDSWTKALVSSRRAMARTCFFTCLLATAAVSTSYTKGSPCLSRLDKVPKAHVRRVFASSKRTRPGRKTPRSSSYVVRSLMTSFGSDCFGSPLFPSLDSHPYFLRTDRAA